MRVSAAVFHGSASAGQNQNVYRSESEKDKLAHRVPICTL